MFFDEAHEHTDDRMRLSDYQRLLSTSPKLNVSLLLSSPFSSTISGRIFYAWGVTFSSIHCQ